MKMNLSDVLIALIATQNTPDLFSLSRTVTFFNSPGFTNDC